ncbi:AimR family lysis-lysogeny pheromone receptor [Alkalihalobacterium alkalinitrilicum]|uniref:AimR family lysis-lysogeny pheromone receptor n=1 Tax=Alkalihalobacterium alkalinitrilicum TaxID=427920 RepID=UPI000994DEFA|nr:AimR family lysis-lysogeny pheromone receptor [Alkalihalobacterium alkalinitrilicum]
MDDNNQDILEYLSSADDIKQTIISLNPATALARTALEYVINNNMTDVLDHLIENLSASENEESQIWAEVYRIDREVVKGQLSLIEATSTLTYIQTNSKEINALRKVLQLYNYYDLKSFEMISSMSELVRAEIEHLEDGYMKNSLLTRFGLIMQSVYVHLNQLELSRNYGNFICKNEVNELAIGIAFKNLGNSFIQSNLDFAVAAFNKSKEVFKKLGHHVELTNAQSSLNFAYCFWNRPEKYSRTSPYSALEEKQGYAFYLIKTKNFEEAKKLLDEVKPKITNNFQLGFHYYYRGILENNEDRFYESVTHFKKAGDYYYRNLPLIELKKLGVNNAVLDALRV